MGCRGRLLADREFSWRMLVEDWLRQIGKIRRLTESDPAPPAR
jgi:hypothetical protein